MKDYSQHTRTPTPPWACRPPLGAPPRPPLGTLPARPGQGLTPVCGQCSSVGADTLLSVCSADGGTWAALAPGCHGQPEVKAPGQERGMFSHRFQRWHLSRPAAGPRAPCRHPLLPSGLGTPRLWRCSRADCPLPTPGPAAGRMDTRDMGASSPPPLAPNISVPHRCLLLLYEDIGTSR